MQRSFQREISYRVRLAVFNRQHTPTDSMPGLSAILSAAPNFLPSGLYRRLRFLTESALLKRTNAARGLMQNSAITAGRELALPDGIASPHPENLVAYFYVEKNRQSKKESQARIAFIENTPHPVRWGSHFPRGLPGVPRPSLSGLRFLLRRHFFHRKD